MGQSATLYRISSNDFSKVEDSPNDFGLFEINKSFEIFEKTFEGLRFVLSKRKDGNSINLVDQIFFPKTFVGELIDYSELHFDNLLENADLPTEPIYYNKPTVVIEIASLLDNISNEWFEKTFDPDDLNAKGIYPGEVWNRRTEPEFAFNVNNMTQEFSRLKKFYNSARAEGDYILSYVG